MKKYLEKGKKWGKSFWNFIKKHHKKIILSLIVVASLIGLYFYFTSSYNQLTTYVMDHYEEVTHREIEIDSSLSGEDEMFTKIINEKGTDFKILQLTDLHLGGSRASYMEDIQAFDAMYRLIQYTEPDLIVLTGDLLFSSLLSRNVNNLNAAVALKMFMYKVNIPWTMVFGNHDSEFYNLYNDQELSTIYAAGNEKCLLQPTYVQGILDYTDRAILLYNGEEEINMALLMMDSNELIAKDTHSIDWYNKMIDKIDAKFQKKVPSMLFLHMPLYEYQEAYQLYEEKSKEVVSFYGKKRENICYEVRTSLFDSIVEKGNTKAIFVGHDHLNDFSLEYKGVRLTYGKSIDYITYKGIGRKKEQRGGTLITVHEDSSFDIEPIRLMDIE